MFKRLKYVKTRNAEMASLRAYIDGEFEGARKTAKTAQELGEAEQMAYSICQYEMNRLDFLQQEDLIEKLKKAPFEVPEDYWYDGGWGYQRVLHKRGEVWARHELKKIRNADIEFWFKLVLPILALILSVIALLEKSH